MEIIEKNYSHLVISDLEVAIQRLPIVSRHITPSPQELREQIESILKSYDISYTVKLTRQELQVKAQCGPLVSSAENPQRKDIP